MWSTKSEQTVRVTRLLYGYYNGEHFAVVKQNPLDELDLLIGFEENSLRRDPFRVLNQIVLALFVVKREK